MAKKDPKSKLRKKLYAQLAVNFKKMSELLEEYANLDDLSETTERKKSNVHIWTRPQLEKLERLLKEHGNDVDKISKQLDLPLAEVKKKVHVYELAEKFTTPKKQIKAADDHVSDSAEEGSEEEVSE